MLLPNTLVMSEPQSKPAHDIEFDPARLLDIFNNDREAVSQILVEAAASIREIIDLIPKEVASKDKQAVASLLHTLTGVAANIGAHRLSSMSGHFIKHIRQRQNLPSDLVERLRSAYDRFVVQIQRYLGPSI